jgi:hypothetical protein
MPVANGVAGEFADDAQERVRRVIGQNKRLEVLEVDVGVYDLAQKIV